MRATVRISGIRESQAKLRAALPAVRRTIVAEVTRQAYALLALVQEKLSGLVLHVRSNVLRGSITSRVTESSAGVEAIVGTNVRYARIHEYGGTIQIPEITPINAQALHFEMAGAEVFAMRARAHEVRIPERSYLRSSLADRRAAIMAGIRQAIVSGLREALGR